MEHLKKAEAEPSNSGMHNETSVSTIVGYRACITERKNWLKSIAAPVLSPTVLFWCCLGHAYALDRTESRNQIKAVQDTLLLSTDEAGRSRRDES